jgi:hypothetical protein
MHGKLGFIHLINCSYNTNAKINMIQTFSFSLRLDSASGSQSFFDFQDTFMLHIIALSPHP